MTQKEVKKLKRVELLELLIEQTEANEKLKQENADLRSQLNQRVIVMDEAGSIAEAAVGLSAVFAQAQDAADRYLESIRARQAEAEAQAEELLRKTREACEALERETKERCAAMEQECRHTEPAEAAPIPEPNQPENSRSGFGRLFGKR